MLDMRFGVLVGMVLSAALSRLIPHPPNFTPVTAMALFAGAHFADKHMAFFVPFAAMLLSDALLGWHAVMPLVYGSFALIVCIGFSLRRNASALNVATAAFAGSVLFFVLTNFGVWAMSGLYARTFAGLASCYVAAIPFFGYTLLGDATYTAALFCGFALAQKGLPILRPSSPAGIV